MKKKTKTILISTLIPVFVIGGVSAGVGIQFAISAHTRKNEGEITIYNKNYLENPLLYTEGYKDNGLLIEKPFKKYEFKSSEKVEELKSYLEGIKKENFYIVPLEISLIEKENSDKESYKKQFEEKLAKLDHVTFFYLPKNTNHTIPYGKDFEKWFENPVENLEYFKVLKTEANTELSEEVKNWQEITRERPSHRIARHTLAESIYKHKVSYNDTKLEVIDVLGFGLKNDKDKGYLTVYTKRYLPKDYEKNDNYYKLSKETKNNFVEWIYDLHY